MQNVMTKKRQDALRFELGAVVMTCGVSALINDHGLDPVHFLRRHAHGDWGDESENRSRENEDALEFGDRVMSVYSLSNMPVPKLWIITEADRSVTTFLLPSEY